MAIFNKYKWRLYADNNIEREIVEHLRYSDMDVLWIAEVPDLRKQQDDTFHYQKARELGRYLLTNQRSAFKLLKVFQVLLDFFLYLFN